MLYFRAVERKKKAVERCEEQLLRMEVQATDREENKQIALGTSKLNYLDPRISVAWSETSPHFSLTPSPTLSHTHSILSKYTHSHSYQTLAVFYSPYLTHMWGIRHRYSLS